MSGLLKVIGGLGLIALNVWPATAVTSLFILLGPLGVGLVGLLLQNLPTSCQMG